MPLEGNLRIDAQSRNYFEFAALTASVILIVLFTYLNVYVLPLGDTSVEAVAQDAGELYGLEVGVIGEFSYSTESTYEVVNPATNGSLAVVWIGVGDLPLDGTMVVIKGRMISSPSGPLLMGETILPYDESAEILGNPWILPVCRLLAVVLAWFSLSVLLTGILQIACLLHPDDLARDRMKAMAKVSVTSGAAFFACLSITLMAEPGIELTINVPTICISASLILMLLPFMIKGTAKSRMHELANAIPVLSLILVAIGCLFAAIGVGILGEDFLGSLLTSSLGEFVGGALIGTTGFFLLGVYLGERTCDAIALGDSLSSKGIEVK